MTKTVTCWLCGETRRIGDSHCCSRRAARPAVPRRRWRPSPVVGATWGMVLWFVVWVAAVLGVLVWGVPWGSL